MKRKLDIRSMRSNQTMVYGRKKVQNLGLDDELGSVEGQRWHRVVAVVDDVVVEVCIITDFGSSVWLRRDHDEIVHYRKRRKRKGRSR